MSAAPVARSDAAATANRRAPFRTTSAGGGDFLREIVRRAALVTWAMAATVASADAQIGYTNTLGDFSSPGARADDMVIEHDVLGNGFVVWTAGTTVWAAHRPPGVRTWSSAVVLHNPTGPSTAPENPDIAVDDQGNAVVVWSRHAPTAPQMIGGIVEHAYFVAGSNAWTQAAAVPGAVNALYPAVVMDRLRRVTVMWSESVLDATFFVKVAHYDPARVPASWTGPHSIGGTGNGAGSREDDLVVDRDGNVTAIWDFINTQPQPHRYSVVVARYTPASGAWTGGDILELGDGNASGSQLAVDDAGNVFAVWSQPVGVNNRQLRFARFDRAVGGWSQATTIPASTGAGNTRTATLPAGDALAIWSVDVGSDEVVVASRYLLPTGLWTPPTTLSAPAEDADGGDLDTDALGNAFAVWNRFDGTREIAQASRFTFATGTWSAVKDLGPMGDDGEDVQVALNDAGNAIFGWEFDDDVVEKVMWTEWLALPAAPEITAISAGNGTLLVTFTPPPTSEPAFAATHYEYRLTNVSNLGWIGGTPPFTASPITVRSLTNGVTYTVRIRAWNGAGAGLPSNEVPGTPGDGLLAPTNLRAVSISSNTVTLAWNYQAGSIAPTGFEIEGGVNPGQTIASLPTGSTATTFTFTAPTGAFYVRVRALDATTRSGPSNEIRIFVNVPAPPGPPEDLAGTAALFDLHLTWRRPTTGGAIDRFLLDVSGGFTGSLPLPGTAETFSFSGVPAGTYTFRLRAQNATGVSDPSNPVTLVFPGGCPVPNAPSSLTAQVIRRDVTLFWSRPVGGGIPTRYEIEAGAFPFQTFVVATVGSSSNMFTATNVPSGMFYVRVRAANVCGRSDPSNAIQVNVPITVP
jgi:hypothetical protein